MARSTSTAKRTTAEKPNRELNAQKNKLRGEAEREVLAKHRAEVNEIAEAKFKAAGIPFSRRLTEEERDEKKLRELLAKNPNLRRVIDEEDEASQSTGYEYSTMAQGPRAETPGPHVAGDDAADFQREHDADSDR